MQACLAMRSDNTIVAWGNPAKGGNSSVPSDESIIEAECGFNICHAVKSNGDAYIWGEGTVIGISPTLADVRTISCNPNICAAIRVTDNTMLAWGTVTDAYAQAVAKVNVDSVSCGQNACVARYINGKAAAWGDPLLGGNIMYQSDYTAQKFPANTTVEVSCGDNTCAALLTDGTAVVWGQLKASTYGVTLGPTPAVTKILCGATDCTVIYADKTAKQWGSTNGVASSNPEPAQSFTNVDDIFCTHLNCVVRFADNTAKHWTNTQAPSQTTSNGIVLGGGTHGAVIDIKCYWELCVVQFADHTVTAFGSAFVIDGGKLYPRNAILDAKTNPIDFSCNLPVPTASPTAFPTSSPTVSPTASGVLAPAPPGPQPASDKSSSSSSSSSLTTGGLVGVIFAAVVVLVLGYVAWSKWSGGRATSADTGARDNSQAASAALMS